MVCRDVFIVVFALSSYVFLAPSEGCEGAWFGSNCQYMCHCDGGSSCDLVLGTCPGRCAGGWFGAGCQYVDMAYNINNLMRDGRDETFVLHFPRELNIAFDPAIRFAWMNVVLTDQVKFTISGRAKGREVKVRKPIIQVDLVDSQFELHGEYEAMIDTLTLTFEREGIGVSSVYVSGGRNVALKQSANITSVYGGYGADRAVDGNVDSNFFGGKTCTASSNAKGDHDPKWTLQLAESIRADRYVLYNIEGSNACRMRWFRLQSYNFKELVLLYNQTNNTIQSVYDVRFANASEVNKVVVSVPTSNWVNGEKPCSESSPVLNICEFMIFGDSICPQGKWGLECKHDCGCVHSKQKCHVATGTCYHDGTGPTEPDDEGDEEDVECPPGSWGADCTGTCPPRCQESCLKFTGECPEKEEAGDFQSVLMWNIMLYQTLFMAVLMLAVPAYWYFKKKSDLEADTQDQEVHSHANSVENSADGPSDYSDTQEGQGQLPPADSSVDGPSDPQGGQGQVPSADSPNENLVADQGGNLEQIADDKPHGEPGETEKAGLDAKETSRKSGSELKKESMSSREESSSESGGSHD